MSHRKYKTKLRRDAMEGINTLIETLLHMRRVHDTDDDKLLMCALSEVHIIFQKKMIEMSDSCTISLTPTQAFALRILSTDYVQDITSAIGNRLHQISNEVHKTFN